MSQGDFSRLPVWAQKEITRRDEVIERLVKDVASLTSKLAAGPADSDTFAEPYSDHSRPLGRNVTVRFNGQDVLGGTYDVSMREGDLLIFVNGMQDDTAIIPQSNNSIRIRKVPRKHQTS